MQNVVVALIENRGSFLSLFRTKGKEDGVVISFPSGKVEPGETYEQALVREVEEETSIICKPVEKIGERVIGESRTLHYWRCNYVSGTPSDPETNEVTDVAFRTLQELQKLIPDGTMHPCVRAELKLD